MKKVFKYIVLFVGITGLIVYGIYYFISSRMHYNDSFVNGNLSGNLYNGGLFCEYGGKVYFANPDDSMRLYSMNPNGTHVEKINSDMVTYLNADDHYLYYVRNNSRSHVNFKYFSFNNNSLCRIPRSGGKITILDTEPCLYASLFGNQIFYLHYDTANATQLYQVGIDGKNQKKAYDSYLYTCCALGQYFYYSDPANGNLARYDTETNQTETLLECNCYKPLTYDGFNFYYIDAANGNCLVRTNLNSGNTTAITREGVDCFTVYGSHVFYQTYADNPGLYYLNTESGDAECLLEGTYTYLNITSYYLYFMDYHTNEFFYAPLTNPTDIQTFHPGAEEDESSLGS